jgi:predicted O-methyltransferase YrrM
MDLPFSANVYSEFIDKLSDDIIPEDMRRAQREHKTPSPGIASCRLIALMASLLKPRNIIDIGCGIGISTLSLRLGFPEANIDAVDGNMGRTDVCKSFLDRYDRIHIHNETAADFLSRTDRLYDLAFIDSVKKEYPDIWQTLEPHMASGGTAFFDDVLLYGYVALDDEKVPPKYKNGAGILKNFVSEMSRRYPSFIFPVGGGTLMVRKV